MTDLVVCPTKFSFVNFPQAAGEGGRRAGEARWNPTVLILEVFIKKREVCLSSVKELPLML